VFEADSVILGQVASGWQPADADALVSVELRGACVWLCVCECSSKHILQVSLCCNIVQLVAEHRPLFPLDSARTFN